MHPSDHAIDAAFWELWPRLVDEPRELQRRLARRRGRMFTHRVPRPLCAALRAADTRLHRHTLIEPIDLDDPEAASQRNSVLLTLTSASTHPRTSRAHDSTTDIDSSPPSTLPPPPSAFSSPAAFPQRVTLDGHAVAALAAPVRLPWPGVTLREAADRLGYHPETLRGWLRTPAPTPAPGKKPAGRGTTGPGHPPPPNVELDARPDHRRRDPPAQPVPASDSPFVVRYERRPMGGRDHHGGVRAVAVVWSRRPLDPAHPRGRPADLAWLPESIAAGTDLDADWSQTITRVPVVKPYHGRPRHRGWAWRCPACGRAAKLLYWPGVADAFPRRWDRALRDAIADRRHTGELSAEEADRWDAARRACFDPDHPDAMPHPTPGLACRRCHGVTAYRQHHRGATNHAIAAMTAGLIYSRDLR